MGQRYETETYASFLCLMGKPIAWFINTTHTLNLPAGELYVLFAQKLPVNLESKMVKFYEF
jgi:hypothetical protein